MELEQKAPEHSYLEAYSTSNYFWVVLHKKRVVILSQLFFYNSTYLLLCRISSGINNSEGTAHYQLFVDSLHGRLDQLFIDLPDLG